MGTLLIDIWVNSNLLYKTPTASPEYGHLAYGILRELAGNV